MFSRRLLALVPKARFFIAVCVAMKWASLVVGAAFLFIVARVLAGVLTGAGLTTAPGDLVGAAACAVLGYLFDAAARYAGAKAAAEGKARVRSEVYDKLVRMGPSFRERVGTLQAVQICGEGTQQLETYLGSYVPQIFFAVLAPITLLFFVAPLSPIAALVLFLCVPLIPGAIMAVMRIAKKAMGAYWDSYVDLGGSFLEAVQGLTTLKLFRADARRQRELEDEAEGFRQATMRLLRVQLNSVTIMDFFTFGGAAAGSIAALVQFAQGALDAASALFIVLVALEFFMPMRTLGSFFHTAMGAAPVIDQIFSLLDAPEPPREGVRIEAGDPEIVLTDVGYVYPASAGAGEGDAAVDVREEDAAAGDASQHTASGTAAATAKDVAADAGTTGASQDAAALSGISLEIEPGSFIGITGASGSGKSTLMGILAGTCRSYTGSVKIGGVEASEADPVSLAETVTYVSSASHVFKGTFRTNLLMGDAEAGDYDMWNALSKCHLDDFVLNQGGLDAAVAEGGANLSGGQRQRLAAARALLRDTPVYLFDEVTSAVDADSEYDILTFIQELAFFKTVIVVSHRLGAIQWADCIYVMDGGRIVEAGSHGVLAAAGGRYAQLLAQQERLEQFAREAAHATLALSKTQGEVGIDVPAAMAEAMEAMPPSVATAALQTMKGERIRRLTEAGGSLPAGHPADIPIGVGVKEVDGAAADGDESVATEGADVTATAADDTTNAETAQEAAASDAPTLSLAATLVGLLGLGGALAPTIAATTLWGILAAVVAIVLPVVATAGIEGALGQAGGIALGAAVAGLVACGVVRGPARYAERLVSHDGTFRTLALLRARAFAHLRTLAPARMERRDSADTVALLTSDIDLLEVFYAHVLSPALVALITSIAVVAVLACLNGPIAAVCAAGFIVAGLVFPWVAARVMDKPGRSLRRRAVALSSFLLESLQGLPDLIGFGCAEIRADELGGRMGALAANERSVAQRSSLLGAAPLALARLCGVAAVACAAFGVQAGGVSPGIAVACAVIVLSSFEPVTALAQVGTSLHQTAAAGARVLDLLDEEPVTPDVVQGARLDEFTGAVADDVSFAYGDEPVLCGVDLAIEEGSVVHLAGPSGAGKSTLCRLFMRFWDPDEGAVRLSGVDAREIETSSMRLCESFMTQDTYLFSLSLRDNLRLANENVTDDQLMAAVEKADLLDVVARLPHGLDTRLGEGGEGLSSGERQRVGLARAFLSEAPFMVLDEPTSNLDCLAEAAVLQALSDNRAGKTILIVSHRPTASAIADVRLTVDRGVVS